VHCAKAYIPPTVVISVLMPPLPIPTGVASLDSWHTVFEPQDLPSSVLLVSLLVTALRFIIVILGKRKKRGSHRDTIMEKSSMEQEELIVKPRKDSSQGEEVDLSTSKPIHLVTDLKKKSNSEAQRYDKPHQSSLELHQNEYLESLKQETLEPSLLPIYPWLAPPQRLPGPYDAPYYPLPLPTIAVEKTFGDETQSKNIKLESTSDNRPEELETIVYSRRLPTPNNRESDYLREGVVTVSTKGWRRTQWTVNAG
jgi:hypothetical protein